MNHCGRFGFYFGWVCASVLSPALAQPKLLTPMNAVSVSDEFPDYSQSVDGVAFNLAAKGFLTSSRSKRATSVPLPRGFFVTAPSMHVSGPELTIAYTGYFGGDAVSYVCLFNTSTALRKIWCRNTLPINMQVAIEADSIWVASWNSVERLHPKTGKLIWRNLDLSKAIGYDTRLGSVCFSESDANTVYLQATASSGQSNGGFGITLDKVTGRMLSNVSQGYNKFCSQ